MKVTKELITDLLAIQEMFDARIDTRNLSDSLLAYFVEVFEWINTVETFKNWKAKPGKPLETQLDELADVMAFALSILSQAKESVDEEEFDLTLDEIVNGFNHVRQEFTLDKSSTIMAYVNILVSSLYDEEGIPNIDTFAVAFLVAQPFLIADKYYDIDSVVTAYKTKMDVNHARQDGTADEDKGYV